MSKGIPLGVVSLLLAVGVTAGQSLPLTPPLAPHQQMDLHADPIAVGELSPFVGEAGASSHILTVDMDLALWTVRSRRNEDRAAATAGTGGNPSAGTLYTIREGDLNKHGATGARLSVGYWLTEPSPWIAAEGVRTWGAEAAFFVVGQRSADVRDSTTPTILRPFFDVNTGRGTAFIVALPGLVSGTFEVAATRKEFWGAELNGWRNVTVDSPGTVCSADVLGGVRYLSLNQDLVFRTASLYDTDLRSFPQFQFLAGNRVSVTDFFAVRNRFYGMQGGVAGRLHFVTVTIEADLKLALGATEQQYTVGGQQTRTAPNGTVTTTNGGLLAQPSNSGRFTKVRFSEVPEVNVTVGWRVLDCLTVKLGASALYWNRVAFPGDQLDRAVDVTQLANFPGTANAPPAVQIAPTLPMRDSYLWLVGINTGVELVW